jgi:hypothetical protein
LANINPYQASHIFDTEISFNLYYKVSSIYPPNIGCDIFWVLNYLFKAITCPRFPLMELTNTHNEQSIKLLILCSMCMGMRTRVFRN